MEPIRALPLVEQLRPGEILHMVGDDHNAPHLRVGEFAVIDTTDTMPQHGELFAMQYSRGRPQIMEAIFVYGKPWSMWRNSEKAPWLCAQLSRRTASDGPHSLATFQAPCMGRVVGIYAAAPMMQAPMIAGGQ